MHARAHRRTRIAAVVQNYRTVVDTLLAAKSLLASRTEIDDVIVVDNDRDDETRSAMADVAARVTYLRADRNLGFSGGMNLGIREALRRGADRVLLVNSDVIVPPDCVERLASAIDSRPGAGVVGPLLLSRSNPDRIASAGLTYAVRTGRMRQLHEGELAGRHEFQMRMDVDAVSGCVMLVRRTVFDAVGLLDERFFYGFEDLDFCLRARRAGFTTVLAGLAAAHHEGGRSIGATSPRRLYFAARGHLLLSRRAGPPVGLLASAFRTCSVVLLNVAHAVRSTGAPLPVRVAAVARGVRDYFAGRFGPDSEAT